MRISGLIQSPTGRQWTETIPEVGLINANGHSYFGETFTFHGTAPNGATIDLHGNPGFNMSAGPGNPNQWGKVGITCTGTPFPLPSS